MTQDALESLFSQIRGLGRFNDHPSPSEIIIRPKKLLLANKLSNLSSKINHEDSTEQVDTYLTCKMIQNVFNSAEVLEETESLEDYEDITNFENIFHDSVLNETETTLTESEEEALAFIAGFIAYRERKKKTTPH